MSSTNPDHTTDAAKRAECIGEIVEAGRAAGHSMGFAERVARSYADAASSTNPDHTTDADCTLGADACCTSCGVYHGEPCSDCSGRGFHAERCRRVDTALAFVARHGITLSEDSSAVWHDDSEAGAYFRSDQRRAAQIMADDSGRHVEIYDCDGITVHAADAARGER